MLAAAERERPPAQGHTEHDRHLHEHAVLCARTANAHCVCCTGALLICEILAVAAFINHNMIAAAARRRVARRQ
jgi:hypothetical protein